MMDMMKCGSGYVLVSHHVSNIVPTSVTRESPEIGPELLRFNPFPAPYSSQKGIYSDLVKPHGHT